MRNLACDDLLRTTGTKLSLIDTCIDLIKLFSKIALPSTRARLAFMPQTDSMSARAS
jgi:hypothetical protein